LLEPCRCLLDSCAPLPNAGIDRGLFGVLLMDVDGQRYRVFFVFYPEALIDIAQTAALSAKLGMQNAGFLDRCRLVAPNEMQSRNALMTMRVVCGEKPLEPVNLIPDVAVSPLESVNLLRRLEYPADLQPAKTSSSSGISSATSSSSRFIAPKLFR
jgi:hypothetical protein